MSKTSSFSIIICGEDDRGLDVTLESIANQTINNVRVIFLLNLNTEKENMLSRKYRNLHLYFADSNCNSFPECLEKVKSPYALCLAPTEILLTFNALSDYQDTFEENPNTNIIISNTVVTDSVGKVLYSNSISIKKSYHTNYLLTPLIYRSDGRGIAFRVPPYTANLPQSLIELLITLNKKGGIFPLNANLNTLSENNLHSLLYGKNSFKKIWWNYLFLGRERGTFQTLSYYYKQLSLYPCYTNKPNLLYKIASILLYPKSAFQEWGYELRSDLFCLGFEIVEWIGTIFFFFMNIKGNKEHNQNKFALISHVLPPSPSGQSVVIERLLRDVNKEEYILINSHPAANKNNLISPLLAKTFLLDENLSPVKFYRFQLLFVLANILQSFARGWKIAQISHREGCGVIIACSGDLIDLPAAYLASVFTHAKYYAYYFDDYRFQWVDKKRRLFSLLTEKVLLRKMDGAIVPNESLQKQILKRRFIKTIVIHNPANDIKQLPKRNMPESPYRIIYTGSVYHVNAAAIKNVIDALDLLDTEGFELHIYTSQPKDLLEEYGVCGKNVKYHFHVPPEEINKIQENAFLLLIPFSFDSSIPEVIQTSAPGKLGDYLSSGTPILAHVPDDSFVAKYLLEKNCGFVISSNNPERIAKQILDLAKSPQTRQEIALNAFQAGKEDFNRLDAQNKFLGFIRNAEKKPGVLHVSYSDLFGKEFNGFMLGERLRQHNFHSFLSVAMVMSSSPYVHEYSGGSYLNIFNSLSKYILDKFSIQSLYPAYTEKGMFPKKMLKSEIDIIHLQLIHAVPYFNLRIIPDLSRKYPLVYTLHDQWAYTGHCIHPLECEGWLSGCHNCPDLERSISMRKDRAAFMYRLKKKIFAKSSLHLIVASQWMHERVKKSPIMSHLPCTVIPFGINHKMFYPEDKKISREFLKIPPNNKVITFRSTPGNLYKGMEYIYEALEWINQSNITILTTDSKGAFEKFKQKFHIIELGLVTDQNALRKVFSAADIFLSPSLAESFGMMPLEAMACGTPTIVFKGTGLEKLTGAPTIGTAVDYKDGQALGRAVEELLKNHDELNIRSTKGIHFVRENYSIENYVRQHIQLYNSLL